MHIVPDFSCFAKKKFVRLRRFCMGWYTKTSNLPQRRLLHVVLEKKFIADHRPILSIKIQTIGSHQRNYAVYSKSTNGKTHETLNYRPTLDFTNVTFKKPAANTDFTA